MDCSIEWTLRDDSLLRAYVDFSASTVGSHMLGATAGTVLGEEGLCRSGGRDEAFGCVTSW
jgi:hypothetical protein